MTAVRSSLSALNSPASNCSSLRLFVISGLRCECAEFVLCLLDRHPPLGQLPDQINHFRVLLPVLWLPIQRRT